MICEICRRNPCDPQCPNYVSPKLKHYCSSCGEGIYEGEEYIENEDGDMRHYECFYGMRDLLEWLGYDIQYMRDDYD